MWPGNVSLTPYWLASLWSHVNRPSHSWDTAFSKFDLEKGQGNSSRSQSRFNTLSTRIPFDPCRSALPLLGYSYFKIWRWKFKVKIIGEVKVESHNIGPIFSGNAKRLTSIQVSTTAIWRPTFCERITVPTNRMNSVRNQFHPRKGVI